MSQNPSQVMRRVIIILHPNNNILFPVFQVFFLNKYGAAESIKVLRRFSAKGKKEEQYFETIKDVLQITSEKCKCDTPFYIIMILL